VDYLRRYGDRNAANIAICVDQSRQATATWFWMHGTPSSDRRKGWKNELFGDGHVEMRRPDQVVGRWAAANPAAW
jgi:prepilin-type processing-associated H-X9-DG protein